MFEHKTAAFKARNNSRNAQEPEKKGRTKRKETHTNTRNKNESPTVSVLGKK
jgi:hypothetical protein